jgi:hypothetical protein
LTCPPGINDSGNANPMHFGLGTDRKFGRLEPSLQAAHSHTITNLFHHLFPFAKSRPSFAETPQGIV